MADVKWFKISVDIFDNRKIKQIESMPDGDSLLVIWFKLLSLAANVNDNGLVYLTKEVPYTEEMLVTQFNRPLPVIRLAINTFTHFGMVEVIDNMLHLSNWEKYQSTDRLAEIREQNRLRKQAQRLREKEQKLSSPSRDSRVTSKGQVTHCHALDIDIDIDKNKNIERYIDNNKDIDSIDKESIEDTIGSSNTEPIRSKYGSYKNVLLSDEELDQLKAEFPYNYEKKIQRLSEYMASSHRTYPNHLATIRKWAKEDEEKQGGGSIFPDDGLLDILEGRA